MARFATMLAGRYYVGDLCYVIRDDNWSTLCDTIFEKVGDRTVILNGAFNLPDGRRFAIHSTAYGDGEYRDLENRKYCVDAGSIGCILVTDCDVSEEEIIERALGHIIEFDEPFQTMVLDEGTIHIGHIEINTLDDPWEDDEDEDESCYDCGYNSYNCQCEVD